MNTKRFLHYFLSMTMIASLLIMTSCGEDPVEPVEEAPSFLITGVDAGEEEMTTVEVGEEVDFDLNVTAPGGFNRLLVEKTVNGTTVTVLDTARTGAATTSFMLPFSYTPTAEEAGEEVIFDFFVVDDNNLDNTYTYTVNVNEPALMEYEAVLLGGQSSAEPSFYNSIEDVRYTYSEAKNNPNLVDFLYYYVNSTSSGTAPLNTIAAPANTAARATFEAAGLPLPAEMDNATQFKALPASTTYEGVVTNADIINAFEENPAAADTRITQLQEGQTFAFMLDESRGGRYGVVRVAEIADATSGAERTIILDVKVQEADN